MEASTHSTHDEAADCAAPADDVGRWQWLGVLGAGLIAAAITAIAVPSAEQDAAMTSPPVPTVTHGNSR